MSRRLDDLQPFAQTRAQMLLDLFAAHSIPCRVTYTLRTLMEQQALFAQGRLPLEEVNHLRAACGMYLLTEADNTYIVTNCDGVRYPSAHQSGAAADIVPLIGGEPCWDLSKVGTTLREMGRLADSLGHIRWGGSWPPIEPKTGLGWDPTHFEFEEV